MVTPEEKQELVDNLKGLRYYRIHLWGYGGESAYINLSKEAYEFWKPVVDEHGDSDLVGYMVNAEDGDYELSDIDSIPPEADFMKDEEGDGRPWYEHHNEFSHQNGVSYDCARITVEEIDGEEYNSKHIADVIDGTDLAEVVNKIQEDSNWEIELTDGGEYDAFEDQGEYVCQFYSSEKGTFFDGIIVTTGDFDPKKLKFILNEYPNGEDIVDGVLYDGKEIDNQGGDTNGKGYSAHIWQN